MAMEVRKEHADRLLRLPDIVGERDADGRFTTPPIVPISESAWVRGVRAGRFPQPVRLGPRTVAWRASDVYALVENGIDAPKQSAASAR